MTVVRDHGGNPNEEDAFCGAFFPEIRDGAGVRILVTGGAGFIGSHLVRLLLRRPSITRVVNYDALTYAGNPANNMREAEDARYRFVHADILDGGTLARVVKDERVDAVFHLAAESHVDRSLQDPSPFVRTNVEGTLRVLDVVRAHPAMRLVHVSTDEVYGALSADGLPLKEDARLAPMNPYAASKAGADHLVASYAHTYSLDIVTTRSSNNYGPFQLPEKMIPRFILRALFAHDLPLFGDGEHLRSWIHVSDHCEGLVRALESGKRGEIYHLGSNEELENRVVGDRILALTKSASRLVHVTDRIGHDRRYAIDSTKALRELGFRMTIDFETGLRDTVRWYQENPEWWKPLTAHAQ